ncbi:hypothetical protein BD779DRAFT_1470714 [Infundibulicybe gibba]|nr:hypothetical protein BD779DRAFT_1470714 [Infundibulicybe gibba]
MLAVPLAASLSLVGVPLSPQYPNAFYSPLGLSHHLFQPLVQPPAPAITAEHVFQPPQPPHRHYPTPTCVSAQHNTAPFYVVGAVAARISLPNVRISPETTCPEDLNHKSQQISIIRLRLVIIGARMTENQ